MRRARAANDSLTLRSGRSPAPGWLAGLFLAVWALSLPVSLPVAIGVGTQLGAAPHAGGMPLITVLTGRIHSGHGQAGSEPSLPVAGQQLGILNAAEPPVLAAGAVDAVPPERPVRPAGWAVRDWAAPLPSLRDHARLSRAPPAFRIAYHIV